MKGATRTPQFLAKNPNGRIPTLELDDGTFLAESDAILWYLAEGTPFLPADRLGRAQVLQWMFFEQYSHEPYVATPRFIVRHLPADSPRRAELPDRLERGRDALAVMETHLKTRTLLRRRALLDRGHRAVRLHARGAARRASISSPTRTCSRGWAAWLRSRGTSRSRIGRRASRLSRARHRLRHFRRGCCGFWITRARRRRARAPRLSSCTWPVAITTSASGRTAQHALRELDAAHAGIDSRSARDRTRGAAVKAASASCGFGEADTR